MTSQLIYFRFYQTYSNQALAMNNSVVECIFCFCYEQKIFLFWEVHYALLTGTPVFQQETFPCFSKNLSMSKFADGR